MVSKSAKNKGQYFIRVLLCSGTSANPLGSEELAVFCPCGDEEPSVAEVDKEWLVWWVNRNPKCKKNQSNEKYQISKQADAMTVVFMGDREIRACHAANRIFPYIRKA